MTRPRPIPLAYIILAAYLAAWAALVAVALL